MFEINRCQIESFHIYAFRWLKLIFGVIPFLFLDFLYFFINLFKKSKFKNINNQIALVTGGGNGLGQQIAIELAKNCCNIAIADIDFEAANKTANFINKEFNVKSQAYKVDISNFEEVQILKIKIENDLGPVDILINNAGLLETRSTLTESSAIETKRIIDVNLTSHIWTVKTFLTGMKERRKGHIVAISSIAGLLALPVGNSYTATKFGIRGFMESLFYDLCLSNYSDYIQLTTIYPYFIATNKQIIDFMEKNKLLQFLPAMNTSYIAEQVIEGILRNKYEIILPNWYPWIIQIQRILPKRTFNYYAKKVFVIQPK